MRDPRSKLLAAMLSACVLTGTASLGAAWALPIDAGVRAADPTSPVAYRRHHHYRGITAGQKERRINKRYDCDKFSSRPRCLNAGPMTPG